MNLYNPADRKLNDEEFYCGEHLTDLAIILVQLRDKTITLQDAHDRIAHDIIVEHVIRNSDCECRQYLYQMEDEIRRLKCPKA